MNKPGTCEAGMFRVHGSVQELISYCRETFQCAEFRQAQMRAAGVVGKQIKFCEKGQINLSFLKKAQDRLAATSRSGGLALFSSLKARTQESRPHQRTFLKPLIQSVRAYNMGTHHVANTRGNYKNE